MFKRHPISLYVVWVIILLIIPLPLIMLLNTQLIDTTRNLLVYDAGVIAYTWWLEIIFLSTRPRWLDRLIGLPAMYFVHGMVGVMALVVATIHVQLSFSMHPIIRNTGHIAWYLAIFGIVYASLFLSGWLVDRFPVAQKLKEKLQFFFKHQLSIWIHRLNFVVIALIWLHVHVIPRISNLTSFVIVFDFYTIVALGIYAWHKFVSPTAEKLSGEVTNNFVASDHVRQIIIKLNQKANKPVAGDFYFLSFRVKEVSKEAHPFSVTTIDQLPEITFTIQTSGDFTQSLSKVKSGDIVNLEGPFGRFDSIVKKDVENTPLVLIGMGTGLAPLISLSEFYNKSRSIHLFWSTREQDKNIFDKQLNKILSNNNIVLEKQVHRFLKEDYQKLLTNEELKNGRFIIVGSASGVLEIEKILKELGVSRTRLTDERLTM